MHPMVKNILGSNNEPVSQLQEVLNIEGQLWLQKLSQLDSIDLRDVI